MTASIEHTSGQMILDMETLRSSDVVAGLTIQERFEEFHRLNPWVLEALETLTADYLERGHRRVGMKMLAEVLRWQYGRATKGDEFRLNNNYTSRYVRLIVGRHPDWEDVFSIRQLQSA